MTRKLTLIYENDFNEKYEASIKTEYDDDEVLIDWVLHSGLRGVGIQKDAINVVGPNQDFRDRLVGGWNIPNVTTSKTGDGNDQ